GDTARGGRRGTGGFTPSAPSSARSELSESGSVNPSCHQRSQASPLRDSSGASGAVSGTTPLTGSVLSAKNSTPWAPAEDSSATESQSILSKVSSAVW